MQQSHRLTFRYDPDRANHDPQHRSVSESALACLAGLAQRVRFHLRARAPFDDDEWARRVERWSGEQGIGFLAMEDEEPCGIAGALLEESGRAQLVSMWTAPGHRQRGAGRLLVEAVTGWGASRGLQTIRLMVTSQNRTALCFYERLGFSRTGRVEPYPNDPALVEWEMARCLE